MGLGLLLRGRFLRDLHGLQPARLRRLRREGTPPSPEQDAVLARTRRLVAVGLAVMAVGWLAVIAAILA